MASLGTVSRPAPAEDPLERLSAICAALPKTARERSGGHAVFRVRKRTFAHFLGDHHGDGIVGVVFKAERGENEALVETHRERFYMPDYVGSRGWVGLRLDRDAADWAEVADRVAECYPIVAPKSLGASVEAPPPAEGAATAGDRVGAMPTPLEVVTRAVARFNAGDLDGFVALFAPDAEFQDVAEIPGSTTYRNRDGIRAWATTVREAMDELRFEIGDPAEAGDMVAVQTRAIASGRGSGAEVDWTFTTLWRVRDSLIAYHHGYSERAEAIRELEREAGA